MIIRNIFMWKKVHMHFIDEDQFQTDHLNQYTLPNWRITIFNKIVECYNSLLRMNMLNSYHSWKHKKMKEYLK